eukprot:scaffold34591_cov183-Amphora_coffeaeformis.AAC.2
MTQLGKNSKTITTAPTEYISPAERPGTLANWQAQATTRWAVASYKVNAALCDSSNLVVDKVTDFGKSARSLADAAVEMAQRPLNLAGASTTLLHDKNSFEPGSNRQSVEKTVEESKMIPEMTGASQSEGGTAFIDFDFVLDKYEGKQFYYRKLAWTVFPWKITIVLLVCLVLAEVVDWSPMQQALTAQAPNWCKWTVLEETPFVELVKTKPAVADSSAGLELTIHDIGLRMTGVSLGRGKVDLGSNYRSKS